MDMEQMLVFGVLAQEEYKNNPPNILEWIRALKGCSELYMAAARHLAETPPDYKEAARVIRVAVEAGDDIQSRVVLAFVMSGQASNEMLEHIQDQFKEG